MKCPKCKGTAVYDAPRYTGDIASIRCLNCGLHVWQPVTVAMPEIPSVGAHAKRPDVAERNRELTRLRMKRMRLNRALAELGTVREMEARLG